MKIVTFNGVKFILTSDTSEALGELHRQMPSIMADVTGMRDSQSGDQKYFNRQDSWDIKQLHGDTTVTFYSKLVSKGKKVSKEFSTIRESSAPSLGLVYELGSRDETNAIITEGFFISPTLDWYTPSIVINLKEEDFGVTSNVEMPLFISSTLDITPLIELPVHTNFDGSLVQSGGVKDGSFWPQDNAYDPDRLSGFYEEDNSYHEIISIDGITVYEITLHDYYRLDWWYVCYGPMPVIDENYGYDGEYEYWYGSDVSVRSGGGGIATEYIEELDWERNRAWCYVGTFDTYTRTANIAHRTVDWSTGWEGDPILGDCVGTKDPTGVPYITNTRINQKYTVIVPSEESVGSVLEFTLWDESVDTHMVTCGVNCLRIYEYQGFPVYIIVIADSIFEMEQVSVVRYFAIYKDILYSSEEFITNESKYTPRLHDVYNAKKSAIAQARACKVNYKYSEITNFSFEEDDNKGNIVQDRAMIFRKE